MTALLFYLSLFSYNSAKLLQDASLPWRINWQKKLFEITVADDGSTDETVEMLENFKARQSLNFNGLL